MESLRAWATPYGGDPFLYISLLAIVSLVALLLLKARLSAFTLNRFIRLGALIALPLSFVSMEMGDNNWGVLWWPLSGRCWWPSSARTKSISVR